eukprot:7140943-Prymnesium_polylepis.1
MWSTARASLTSLFGWEAVIPAYMAGCALIFEILQRVFSAVRAATRLTSRGPQLLVQAAECRRERSPHTSRSQMTHAVSPAAVRTDLERLKG